MCYNTLMNDDNIIQFPTKGRRSPSNENIKPIVDEDLEEAKAIANIAMTHLIQDLSRMGMKVSPAHPSWRDMGVIQNLLLATACRHTGTSHVLQDALEEMYEEIMTMRRMIEMMNEDPPDDAS